MSFKRLANGFAYPVTAVVGRLCAQAKRRQGFVPLALIRRLIAAAKREGWLPRQTGSIEAKVARAEALGYGEQHISRLVFPPGSAAPPLAEAVRAKIAAQQARFRDFSPASEPFESSAAEEPPDLLLPVLESPK